MDRTRWEDETWNMKWQLSLMPQLTVNWAEMSIKLCINILFSHCAFFGWRRFGLRARKTLYYIYFFLNLNFNFSDVLHYVIELEKWQLKIGSWKRSKNWSRRLTKKLVILLNIDVNAESDWWFGFCKRCLKKNVKDVTKKNSITIILYSFIYF